MLTTYEWRLKELLAKKGMTRQELADGYNVSLVTIHQLCALRNPPILPGEKLESLLRVLDCDLEELIAKVEVPGYILLQS